MHSKLLSYRDLAILWRVIVVVIACQFAGGFIGIAYGFHHSAFMNFWVGGAVGTAPGFVLGAIWHLSRTADRNEAIPSVTLMGLMAAALFSAAVFSVIPRMKSDMRMLATLSQFDQKGIVRIEIFDRDRETAIMTVTEPAAVAAFAQAITDTAGHSPSHPKYSHSWYAVVTGLKTYEFELHLNPVFPDSVIGYSLTRSEHPDSYQVTFRSGALRVWVEEYLLRGKAAGR